MDEDATYRRLRVIVDVQRRGLTDEEMERHDRLVESSPEVGYLPINAFWSWNVEVVDDPAELEPLSTGGFTATDDEVLAQVIAEIRSRVSVELALRLTRRQIPLDPRFQKLLGVGRAPTGGELAESLARMLELPAPKSPESQQLLVLMALVAQGWYDNPWAPTDASHAGGDLASRAASNLPQADRSKALSELGYPGDRWDHFIGEVAARLLRAMGVRIT